VEGLTNQSDSAIPTAVDGEPIQKLHDLPNAASLQKKMALYIMASPREIAMQAICDKTSCRQIAAQTCFSDL